MTEDELTEALRMADSAGRPGWVLHWAATLDPRKPADAAAFWRVVVAEWSHFDAIPHDLFAMLFDMFRDTAPGAPELPERFTVYRGQDYDDEPGLSWTLARNVAESFARGHRWTRHPTPHVFEWDISRDQVAFFTDARNESEVVVIEAPDLMDF